MVKITGVAIMLGGEIHNFYTTLKNPGASDTPCQQIYQDDVGVGVTITPKKILHFPIHNVFCIERVYE